MNVAEIRIVTIKGCTRSLVLLVASGLSIAWILIAHVPSASAATPSSWSELSPAASPTARWYPATLYDPATSRIILFGGSNGSTFYSDTWSWDGGNWDQLSPGSSPSARNGAAIAYDSASDQLLLFGGQNNGTVYNDTWSWDGSNWNLLTPATSPPADDGGQMAFDEATGKVILFTSTGDTWSWNGTNWTQLAPTASPPARGDGAMAYDWATGEIVLFGGSNGNGASYLGDTWTWNGSDWTQLAPATSPLRPGLHCRTDDLRRQSGSASSVRGTQPK